MVSLCDRYHGDDAEQFLEKGIVLRIRFFGSAHTKKKVSPVHTLSPDFASAVSDIVCDLRH